MKVGVAGQGAFGVKHLEAIQKIDGIEVATLTGGSPDSTAEVAGEIHKRIQTGELRIQQMDVQTYFFRRTSMNALGKQRSWTDHLLWHHACHTVDLFQYQTGETASQAYALQGPVHPELSGIPHHAAGVTRLRPACLLR